MNPWWHGPDVQILGILAGILLIYVECNRPGGVVPGCLGGLLVLLSVHRLAGFPLQAPGVAMALAGTSLVLVGVRSAMLAAVGTGLITWGLWGLVQPSGAGSVHLSVALFVGLVFGITTKWLGGIALRARSNKRPRAQTTGGAGNAAALNRVD